MSKPVKKLTEYVVSEGSIVEFHAREFASDRHADNRKSSNVNDNNSINFESCRQERGDDDEIPVTLPVESQKGPTCRFRAPYLRDKDAVTTTLNFNLKIAGDDTPYPVKVIVKRVQRALIFQGGVALGAYEAGVFETLVNHLKELEVNQVTQGLKDKERPLFDIIAGASIGAMNAAIVASSIIEHGSKQDIKGWENAVKKVGQFWNLQKKRSPTLADSFDMNPFYHFLWDYLHITNKSFKRFTLELSEEIGSKFFEGLYSNIDPSWKQWYNSTARYWFGVDPTFLKDYLVDGWYVPATAEAARRYYSSQQFKHFGARNVAAGIPPWSMFGRFFDFADESNWMPRIDNKHFLSYSLKETLEGLSHFPIVVEKEQQVREHHARLLLVAVDVKTGDAVTFDSYSKEAKFHNNKSSIDCEKGIEVEHALASGTFPNFFDYPKFEVNGDSQESGSSTIEKHAFWDGGYRSNTPLREVLQAHRDYWHKTRGKRDKDTKDDENDVPDLEVYIADLWPSELEEEPVSYDLDFVEDRKHDLLLADRTDYDEQVANVVTDYVDLAKQFKSLAEKHGASPKEIEHILEKKGRSKNTEGRPRPYNELLGGRFRLTKVIRIDRKDDGNNVATNIFDYSDKTVESLIEQGRIDTKNQLKKQSSEDQIEELTE
jgi:NTE family protein